jgi:thiol-disulfide isomerase/thioredoxin
MNKKVVIVAVTIIVLISAAIAYVLLLPKDPTPMDQPPKTTQQKTSENNSNTTTQDRAGVYTDYSEKALLATTHTKLLFFHAPWCPQCRAIEKSIETGGVPEDVTVFKVDYDSNQELRQKYGVTLQTTFVKIDGKNNKIESYVAYEEPDFASVKRELLP